jgi:hypothetical protein
MYYKVWFGFAIAGTWTTAFFIIAAILFALKK